MHREVTRTGEAPVARLEPAWIGPLLAGHSNWLRYGLAILFVLGLTSLRSALNPWLGTSAPLLPHLLAVLFAAVLCGVGPALLACFLAPIVLSITLVLTDSAGDWRPWLAHMGLFTLIGLLLTLMLHGLQRVYRRQNETLREYMAVLREATTRESQLQLMADSLPVLLAYVDKDLNYRFNNRQYASSFSADQLERKRMQDVLDAASFAVAEPHLREVLAGKTVVHEREMMTTAAGKRSLRVHYIPDRADDGSVRGFFVMGEDLTEVKATQQKLQDAQQRLSIALRAARSGTFEWDIATGVNRWSGEMLELYGFRADEFGGTHDAWLSCIYPEDREHVVASVPRTLKEGSNRLEFRIRRNDTGELRWIQSRGKVIYAEDGKPVRMIGINIDVTEHKLAEAALRDSEHRLKLIYDNASDSLYLVEVEAEDRYRFVSVNERFLRVSGYTRDQVEGELIEGVMPPDNCAVARAKFRETMRASRPVVYEETAELPAGRRHGRITLVPIQTVNGLTTHILGAITDVTAAKEAEAALRQEARRKDEFLAMLAHELRNPLAPISNIAHLLTTRALDPPALQRMGNALQRQATQLTRLVDDLLDVSRITRGVITLRREVVFLEMSVQSAIESLTPTLTTRRQQVRIRGTHRDLQVHGDPARLTQVFANLLSNASKYSPPETPIDVTMEVADAHAVITVRDRGLGIDPQMLPQIFDLFVQADRSIDRQDSGLGVGLTIVKRLVEMHGGTIEARSAGLGHGSEFIVRLPLLVVDRHPLTGSSLQHSLFAREEVTRVLIVDDNEDSAETVAMVLRAAGHQVDVANDAQTALAAMQRAWPSIAFLDLGLPGVDGCVLAQTIRERFSEPLTLVALTGYASESERELALNSGFDHHLVKPADPADILRLVTRSRARVPN